jgi:hypothetical protein
MGYVLGSETESLTFTEHGIKVEPVGLAHAVDPAAPQNRAGGLLAYALCGTAVRAWPDLAFDPHADRVHDQCLALSQYARKSEWSDAARSAEQDDNEMDPDG